MYQEHDYLGSPIFDLYREHRDGKALIIGNGKSRDDINLETVSREYVTFGCNVLYLDFVPDYLFTLNKRIFKEYLGRSLWKETTIIYRVEWTYLYLNEEEKKVDVNKFFHAYDETFFAMNSGYMAAQTAMKMGFKEIHLLGFDMDKTNVYRNKHPDYKYATFHKELKDIFDTMIHRSSHKVDWVQLNGESLNCKSKRIVFVEELR